MSYQLIDKKNLKQNNQNYLESNQFSTDKIGFIRFKILTKEEILKQSVLEITNSKFFNNLGEPVDGGIFDLRLGAILPGQICKTCNSDYTQCIGHNGHINLALPICNYLFIKQIKDLLLMQCNNCFRLINCNTKIASSYKNCPFCKKELSKISLTRPNIFNENGQRLYGDQIYQRFCKIEKDDILKYQLENNISSEPKDFIITTLIVGSTKTRPTLVLEESKLAHDDISYKLSEIQRSNLKLKDVLEKNPLPVVVRGLSNILEYHITTYLDNKIAGYPVSMHKGGKKPLKSLTQRLKGKAGRLRGNLNAKRTNHCARGVITPDNNLRLDQVGVPIKMKYLATVKEDFKQDTFEIEETRVVILKSGQKIKVLANTIERILELKEEGQIKQVVRNLKNNDVCLFNRQPSLHRGSFYCLKIVLQEQHSFSFPSALCVTFNADFDGDEMNLHTLQSDTTKIESLELMGTKNHLTWAKNGKALIGPVKDIISGLYMLKGYYQREPFTTTEKREILLNLDLKDSQLEQIFSDNNLTGPKLFNILLDDRGLNYSNRQKKFEIVNGNWQKGDLTKSIIGCNGSLLTFLNIKWNLDKYWTFLQNLVLLGNNIINYNQLSLNIAELDYRDILRPKVKVLLEELDSTSRYRYQEEHETLEKTIVNSLNHLREKVATILKKEYNNRENQNLRIFIQSQSSGNFLNLVNISGIIGQITINNKRVKDLLVTRNFSFVEQDNLYTQGLSTKNYLEGSQFISFIIGAFAARESIVTMHVKSSRTGYTHRKVTNSFVDIKMGSAGQVIDNDMKIYQQLYGGTGFSIEKSNSTTLLNYLEDLRQEGFSQKDYELIEKLLPEKIVMPLILKDAIISLLIIKNITEPLTNRDLELLLRDSFEPEGSPLGLNCANSVGESATQINLRSRDTSGIGELDMTEGLGRLIELLDTIKTPYLENFNKIVYSKDTSLKEIEEDYNRLNPIYLESLGELQLDQDFKNFSFIVNKKDLEERNIASQTIIETINKWAKIDFTETLVGDSLKYSLKSDNWNLIYQLWMSFKNLRLNNSKIISLTKIKNSDGLSLLVKGGRYKELNLLKLNGQVLNYDLETIEKAHGIEYVRLVLIELLEEFCQSEGFEVDSRLVSLIVDIKTYSGKLLSISRTGVIKEKDSPLSRAVFEIPIRVIVNSAIRGQVEKFKGIFENILVNKLINIGTSLKNYRLNFKKYNRWLQTLKSSSKQIVKN